MCNASDHTAAISKIFRCHRLIGEQRMPETKKNIKTIASHKIEFKIFRFKPNGIDPPHFDSFSLDVTPDMAVLDCLEEIRTKQDDTLMYRHSCHHSACGTCALVINGTERLACITRVLDLRSETVVLEPLRGFKHMGDLTVDMTSFYDHIDPNWPVLRPAEASADQASLLKERPDQRLENCIECGSCVSCCPAARSASHFMGPAALAAIANQISKVSVEEQKALLNYADKPDGQRLCERALSCSRVCPTRVYPARHIADLRKKLGVPAGGQARSNKKTN